MDRLLRELNMDKVGQELYELTERLYPICRSITGNGVRETLRIISEQIPIEVHEVPSGTQVFDWVIPKEWNIRDAYIKNSRGEKIVDFKNSNLHVLSYSTPVKGKFTLEELKEHLFTLPDHPEWIPYFTSYYRESWGFCLTHKQYEGLEDGEYEVLIDSTLEDGSLTYAQLLLEGDIEDEVLLSTYICHPSMCNDNLSGVALLTTLAKYLKDIKLKHSYRFLFIPETIGSITWLSRNEVEAFKIRHGLVATCVADSGTSTYKRTRNGNALIDKIVEKVLIDSDSPYEIIDFAPTGADERQFCYPGFNLSVGSLMRTPYVCYEQYHTSADDLSFIDPESFADSLEKYLGAIYIIEHNATYVNSGPKCEPQLGKRGLINAIGGQKDGKVDEMPIFWVLNFSDGTYSLLDIAVRSGVNFKYIKAAADALLSKNLLVKVDEHQTNPRMWSGSLNLST